MVDIAQAYICWADRHKLHFRLVCISHFRHSIELLLLGVLPGHQVDGSAMYKHRQQHRTKTLLQPRKTNTIVNKERPPQVDRNERLCVWMIMMSRRGLIQRTRLA